MLAVADEWITSYKYINPHIVHSSLTEFQLFIAVYIDRTWKNKDFFHRIRIVYTIIGNYYSSVALNYPPTLHIHASSATDLNYGKIAA